jgi:hypothetical protein
VEAAVVVEAAAAVVAVEEFIVSLVLITVQFIVFYRNIGRLSFGMAF